MFYVYYSEYFGIYMQLLMIYGPPAVLDPSMDISNGY